jgi:hypothetical protein
MRLSQFYDLGHGFYRLTRFKLFCYFLYIFFNFIFQHFVDFELDFIIFSSILLSIKLFLSHYQVTSLASSLELTHVIFLSFLILSFNIGIVYPELRVNSSVFCPFCSLIFFSISSFNIWLI